MYRNKSTGMVIISETNKYTITTAIDERKWQIAIIDGDINGAKTMILELQEQYIIESNTTTINFFDRRLDERVSNG